ncbi:MAG: CotH kinase family protein [Bacteroidaceae bacterium]|nr:CotH kinase family protein [Bacteroidaceae bacterium]
MKSVCRTFATIMVCALSVIYAHAKSDELRSGECYEIRCAEMLNGAVVPADADPVALTHTSFFAKKAALWRITKLNNGNYTIQHAETGRYMTHDGKRTATRRYMSLTDKMNGMASQWSIYPGASHVIITNVYSQYLLNMRRDSHIVGLYNNKTNTATGNERFVLYDKKGKQVTSIDGQPIVFKSLEPPAKTTTTMLSSQYGAQSIQLKFTLNGKSPVYDTRTGNFLFSLPEKQMGKNVELKLACSTFPNAQIFVDGKAASTKGNLSLGTVEGARTYRLAFVENTDTIARTTIQFTYLPIVEIRADSFSKSYWGKGLMTVHDAALSTDSSYTIQLRNRGDWTSRFEKRSMGIKLKDAVGKKVCRSLLGLRSDNYWVLDAMTVDRARMRGRVVMDLWQDFSAASHLGKQAKDAHHASRGRLVEVFLNGKYHGIYNLCERIDRKQLQLAKNTDEMTRGVLYKADQWSTATKFGGSKSWAKSLWKPSGDNESWEGWQAKYPEPSRKHQAQWQPLYDAILFVSNADKNDFCANVGRYFDLPSVRDYYLLIELLFATDNSAKNMYWAAQDYQRNPQLTPIPWDMDGTFGRDWNSISTGCEAHLDYRKYLVNTGHQNALFERLQNLNPDGWNDGMAKRYRELRRTYFAPERLKERFAHYLYLLQQSGADQRETQRWKSVGSSRLNLQQEVERIGQWIEQRIATLDLQYNY